jgi:hypothetical protein
MIINRVIIYRRKLNFATLARCLPIRLAPFPSIYDGCNTREHGATGPSVSPDGGKAISTLLQPNYLHIYIPQVCTRQVSFHRKVIA